MPMSERDLTFRITADLQSARIWELIEAKVTLAIECVSCNRRTTWPPELIRRRLAKATGKRLTAVAGQLRCAACRSRFVRVSRERAASSALTTATARPDPAEKRGFTSRNLDPNARGGGGLR